MLNSLIKYGANVHANNDAALRLASRYGYYDIAKLLLEHGASSLILNWAGLTAIDYAKRYKRHKILKLFEEWNKENKNGQNKRLSAIFRRI